jgi:hypothetical protein
MQMREALGRVEDYRDAFLAEVLRTFVRALLHQCAAPASAGTTAQVDLGAGRARAAGWRLTHLAHSCDVPRHAGGVQSGAGRLAGAHQILPFRRRTPARVGRHPPTEADPKLTSG